MSRSSRPPLLLALLCLLLVLPPGAAAQVAPAPPGALAFPQTGQWLAGAFKTYWEVNGGVRQFGYPISPPIRDTEGKTVQWLERARFEWHPTLPTGQRVLLGLLGTEATQARDDDAFRPVPTPGDGGRWFNQTGHTVRGRFLGHWERSGGLSIYGYPISEAFDERSPTDDETYLVQYFQRYRIEWHPAKAGTAYEIQLGLLGAEAYDGDGAVAPAVPDDLPPVGRGRPVTAAKPLRLYVAGDSFAPWLAGDLSSYGRRDGLSRTTVDYKNSSGLCLTAFYDWPGQIATRMASSPPPEAVVVILGANDALLMQTPSGVTVAPGSAAWRAEYARRAGLVMDAVGGRNGHAYWVGTPIMRDPLRRAAAVAVNEAVADAARSRPWVRRIDTWSLFADPDGGYTDTKPDANGQPVTVRQPDGIHLTRAGTTWIAQAVYAQVRRDWDLGRR